MPIIPDFSYPAVLLETNPFRHILARGLELTSEHIAIKATFPKQILSLSIEGPLYISQMQYQFYPSQHFIYSWFIHFNSGIH